MKVNYSPWNGNGGRKLIRSVHRYARGVFVHGSLVSRLICMDNTNEVIPRNMQVDAMESPAINPQEVFRSGLPVGPSLVVVFVPSKDQDGQPIDQEYGLLRSSKLLAPFFVERRLTQEVGVYGGTISAAALCGARNR